MKHIIELETWERRDNYNFFQSFLNPNISITSEVECDGAKAKSKAAGQSFFLYYLYAVLRSVNEVKEFRYRIDKEGQVVLYDKVDAMTPIKINEQGKFLSVRIVYHEDFETFYRIALQTIKDLPKDGDPYGAAIRGAAEAELDVVNISATPDLYFTSIATAQQNKNGKEYPLLTVGKVVQREGKSVMPIAINVNHGFVDGHHIAIFYKKIEELLK